MLEKIAAVSHARLLGLTLEDGETLLCEARAGQVFFGDAEISHALEERVVEGTGESKDRRGVLVLHSQAIRHDALEEEGEEFLFVRLECPRVKVRDVEHELHSNADAPEFVANARP